MLTLLVVLAFAVYRVTRFIKDDTLIEAQRDWFLRRVSGLDPVPWDLYKRGLGVDRLPSAWRAKVLDLFDCPYCLGVWLSGAAVWIADSCTSVPMPGIMVAAVAGAAMAVWRFCET